MNMHYYFVSFWFLLPNIDSSTTYTLCGWIGTFLFGSGGTEVEYRTTKFKNGIGGSYRYEIVMEKSCNGNMGAIQTNNISSSAVGSSSSLVG